MENKPEFVTEDMLEYLDELRESGITNMFGATPYIEEEFPELERSEAREVLTYWMHTFSQRHSS
jgi:hypothetical protein